MEFSERVKEALVGMRIGARMSKAELSRRSGISPQSLGSYESGRHAPSMDALGKLLDALGATLTDLGREIDRLQEGAEDNHPEATPEPLDPKRLSKEELDEGVMSAERAIRYLLNLGVEEAAKKIDLERVARSAKPEVLKD